ncbi:hypothetical protein HDV00_006081 [Rhizophlyctis rosea]|nr:hypothetical protein HDV00_006081 [Rhizophlyctis rosea]
MVMQKRDPEAAYAPLSVTQNAGDTHERPHKRSNSPVKPPTGPSLLTTLYVNFKVRQTPRTTFAAIILSIVFLFTVAYWWMPMVGGPQSGSVSSSPPPPLKKAVHETLDCLQNVSPAVPAIDRYYRTQKCYNEWRLKEARKLWQDVAEAPLEDLKHWNLPQTDWQAFDLMPETYSCDARHMERIGPKFPTDGGKWICKDRVPKPLAGDCTIFSIGSANDFSFEEAIHTMAPHCKIHTFDCTGDFHNNVTTYHNWCIGEKDETKTEFTNDYQKVGKASEFRKWDTIVETLNISKVNLLKMDIEFFEWQVIPILEETTKPHTLPDQILLEVHMDHRTAPLVRNTTLFKVGPEVARNSAKATVELMRVLDRLGYRVARQERNWYGTCCAELVLIRDFGIGVGGKGGPSGVTVTEEIHGSGAGYPGIS